MRSGDGVEHFDDAPERDAGAAPLNLDDDGLAGHVRIGEDRLAGS